jgi:Mrp family chromosome partitioning ATPase
MKSNNEKQIWFSKAIDPLTQRPLNQVASLADDGTILWHYPLMHQKKTTEDQLNLTSPFPIKIKYQILAKKPQSSNLKKPAEIKNIIAIYSAKGGVGKSTMTFHIAKALANHGLKVGILDADIYGPNQCELFNEYSAPKVVDHHFIPKYTQNIHWLSMGLLTDDKSAPMIWRGPMASKALKQLLMQSQWPDLDYLLIDMPPATGDIQLTMMNEIAITSSIIISTPSASSYKDAEKGLNMMQKLNIDVHGWIDNMTHIHCDHCQVPISLRQAKAPASFQTISTHVDIPLMLPEQHDFQALLSPFLLSFFSEVAKKPTDRSGKIPKIIVE